MLENKCHNCTRCSTQFETEKDTAHTKYFLHMKREHKTLVHFACHENCNGHKKGIN